MQKLFSQEARFKADDGSEFPEWEEKKIGEILAVHHGKDYKNLKKAMCLCMGLADTLFFTKLDEVIEKQKATLAAWEELKKGLLQQMFA